METRDLIPIQLVCKHYKISIDFINTLQELQLIKLTANEGACFIHKKQLNKIEKISRLHYDLDINFEGIDAIYHLLERVKTMKIEITTLNNRLRLYEDF